MDDLKKYYTYAYLREDRTPYYIGKGTENRAFKRSKTDIKPPIDKSRVIFLKQQLTEEEAFKHEIYMIAVFGRKDLGTGILRNLTDGGEGCSGLIHSEDTRNKRSKSNKGNTHSEETKKKIGVAHSGKQISEEHKEKLRDFNIGKKLSKSTKIKISEVTKGQNNPFYGKTHTEETKNKMKKIKNGIKWWNNCEEEKMSIKSPGEGWKLGRKPHDKNHKG